MIQTFLVPQEAAGTRIDIYLAEVLQIARTHVQKACKVGLVRCNEQVCKANLRLEGGEVIEWKPIAQPTIELVPEPISLDIVYADADMLVVNKPRGMVVYPTPAHPHGTLVNALLAHVKQPLPVGADPLRPGIVHRLDRDTSGLLVVALTAHGYASLSAQIQRHEMKRIYTALVHGGPAADRGTIRFNLGRHPKKRTLQAVVREGGREAVTHFWVRERMTQYSLLECQLETGRTHQIRVHLAHIGNPVVQDPVYGRSRDRFPISGQALHAQKLVFKRPSDGEEVHCEAVLPEDMERCIRLAREKRD